MKRRERVSICRFIVKVLPFHGFEGFVWAEWIDSGVVRFYREIYFGDVAEGKDLLGLGLVEITDDAMDAVRI